MSKGPGNKAMYWKVSVPIRDSYPANLFQITTEYDSETGKYKAEIVGLYKRYTAVGRYDTPDEAHRAGERAACKLLLEWMREAKLIE